MTWTLRSSAAPKLGAWLVFVSLLAACANFLGIEERTQDTVGNYPPAGYAGCRPGNCDGCLDVHRPECAARTACANAAGHDDCAGCVCQNCEEPLMDCQRDARCSGIWQCLRETRCDLSERAASNCLDACGSIIQANGGVNGAAFRAATEIRACAASNACLTCLAPQVQQSTRVCTQANACQDCDNCFDQCLCSGEQFGDCRVLCEEEVDAPPAACSQADNCVGCTSCFHACSCSGKTFAECNALCSDPNDPPPDPPPPPACSAETSCVNCADCASQCVCSGGGDQAACAVLCAPPPASDKCIEDPRGQNSVCGGCESCVAEYTCSGTSVEYASHYSCGVSDCCENPQNCTSGFDQCTCYDTGANCFDSTYGSGYCTDYLGTCDQCACTQCPGELGMCWSIYGCQETFECMRATHCEGSACLERCRGDATPQAFAFAEALWACSNGAGCSGCTTTPPDPLACPGASGSTQCLGYVAANVDIWPCCTNDGTMIPTAPPVGPDPLVPDDDPCGLQLNRYWGGARSCEPRAQNNPPRYGALETCPDSTIYGAPYFGALLQGCCRGADHTCGYFDDVTGLGCLSANVFGQYPQPCPGTTTY